MNALIGGGSDRQRAGGVAALYLAAAYVAAMLYFLVFVDYLGAGNGAEKLALLAEHEIGMQVMHLATYGVFGVALTVLALALHARLKVGAPAMAQVATALGLMWSVALIGSALVFNYGMSQVVDTYGSDPSRALAAWLAIESVADGLGGAGGEFLGGTWILLVSWAGLRTGATSTALNWLGVVIGVAGVMSALPQLGTLAIVFGLLQIVWFAWLGVSMWRVPSAETSSTPALGRVRAGALRARGGDRATA